VIVFHYCPHCRLARSTVAASCRCSLRHFRPHTPRCLQTATVNTRYSLRGVNTRLHFVHEACKPIHRHKCYAKRTHYITYNKTGNLIYASEIFIWWSMTFFAPIQIVVDVSTTRLTDHMQSCGSIKRWDIRLNVITANAQSEDRILCVSLATRTCNVICNVLAFVGASDVILNSLSIRKL